MAPLHRHPARRRRGSGRRVGATSLRVASAAPAPSRPRGTAPHRPARPAHRLAGLLALGLFVVAVVLASHGINALTSPHGGTEPGSGSAADASWSLVLVNGTHPLPETFSIETATVPGGERVDVRIADALDALFTATRAAGYAPFVRSGFRTRAEQQRTLDDKIAAYEDEGLDPARAREAALDWVALPGTSEHELGLAVDINDADGDDGLYDWLAAHAHAYGFIQRYPPEKSAITGIAHEPWHYRYVGTDAAAAIWQQGVTLEEYLDGR